MSESSPLLPSPKPRRARRLWTAGIFIGVSVLGSIRLSGPFTHYHENVAACYLTWLRNYDRHGYAVSGFAPVRTTDPARPPGPVPREQLYSHRPPTVSLLASLVARLLGPTELAIRLVGLASLLGLLAVFLPVARRLAGEEGGLLAASLLAAMPLFSFFGVAIAHQTLGVLGALGVILAYLRWREAPSRGRLAALAGAALAASWLDWPGFYGAGAVCVLHLFTSKERRAAALAAPAAATAGMALFLLYLYALDPAELVPLRDLLATGELHRQGASVASYLLALGREAARGFTVPIFLLAGLGLALLRPRTSFPDAAILAVALLGADVLLFQSLAHGHPFLIFPWGPFLALAAGRGLGWLHRRGLGGRVVAGVFLAGVAFQGALYLSRAHGGGSFPYFAEASRSLGESLRRRVAPDETVLVRGYVDLHLLRYYGDRRTALWSPQRGSLERLDLNRREGSLSESAMIERLSRPGHGYSWFVTASFRSAKNHLASLRALEREVEDPEAFVRDRFEFESEARPSALVAFLRGRRPAIEQDGFLYFDLRESR